MTNVIRKPLLVLFLLGLIGSAGAGVQITTSMNFKTSFPFTVGNTKLPAGSYTIRPVDNEQNVMEISSADGKTSAFFETQSSDLEKTPSKGEIVFKKYGDSYVLGDIYEAGTKSGVQAVKTHAERQYEKKGITPTKESVPTTKGSK